MSDLDYSVIADPLSHVHEPACSMLQGGGTDISEVNEALQKAYLDIKYQLKTAVECVEHRSSD